MKRKGRSIRRIAHMLLILFILFNGLAAMHAWHFTHTYEDGNTKHIKEADLSASKKLMLLLTGVKNAKPQNLVQPSLPFQSIVLQSNSKIACWYIPCDKAKGTIILFHGYLGCKSNLLERATYFHELGYNTLLADFMGSGASDGYTTTIGYKEAVQVKTSYEYIRRKGEEPVFLFGNSMGAAAIMKALNDYDLPIAGTILECPFGSMYQTVCNRFHVVGAPVFPMASLLVFWGGLENGFWAFGHNPEAYAANIHCPALLLYGEKDNRVTKEETDSIFKNLAGVKTLKTFAVAGHEDYMKKYNSEWKEAVQQFLQQQE